MVETLINKLLEFFQRKTFVFVEVAFNSDKPYCLTVLNRSRFDIHLNCLVASPDGFPSIENGWSVNDAALFKNKRLKPNQRIRLFLTNEQIGQENVREFRINYSTYLTKKRLIKRYEQSCKHEFDLVDHTIRVTASFSVPIESRQPQNT